MARQTKYTKKELILNLQEAFAFLGVPVTKRKLAKLKQFPAPFTYYKHFGSWRTAQKLAGIPITEPGVRKGTPEAYKLGAIGRAAYKTKRPPRRTKYKHSSPRYSRNINLSLRFKILHRDKFTCQYCGRTTQDGIKLVIDHIVAFSKNGETRPSNLINRPGLHQHTPQAPPPRSNSAPCHP